MTYQIKKFEITENGLHFNQEVKIKNLKTEQSAISWLNSARQATISTEANGRHVTPVGDWTFNVLASEAKGDRCVINYSIETVND